MTIDASIVELINADIDGEISATDRETLQEILAGNPEAKAMHAELSGLSSRLDELPDLDPPPHLKHAILAAAPKPKSRDEGSDRNWLQTLFATPALRYAATFAAGVILTFSLVSSDQARDSAFNDVTDLVGTMSANAPIGRSIQSVDINRPQIAGRVWLREAGPLLVVDFDLVSGGPVEIVATFADQTVWFNGFAQLESPGAAISAAAGQITMQIEGKRRFALFLKHGGDRDIEINLQFNSDGNAVFNTDLRYEQPE